MAYAFNPDGTVTFIEEKIDSYGNIKPKGSPDMLDQSNKSAIGYSNHTSPKPKKKRNKGKKQSYYSNETNRKVVIKISKTDISSQVPVEKTRIITRQSIENFFNRKKAQHQPVTSEELFKAKSKLRDNLLDFFMQQYEQHKEYCHTMGWEQKPISPKKRKKKIDNPKKKVNKASSKHYNHNTPKNTIENIATFSKLKDSLSDSDVIYKSTSKRHPQAGYARDYFGRVQKRDLLNEDNKNEFKQSQNRQSYYDYSNYDKEDDHDSYYDSGSYK